MVDGLACACINGRYCYEGGRPTRCWLRDGKPILNYPQQLVREEAERLAEKEDRSMQFLKVELGLAPPRAYTYGWDGGAIARGDYVVVPPNSYNPNPAIGRVLRLMATPDFTGTVTVLSQKARTDIVQYDVWQGKPFEIPLGDVL